MIFTMPESYAPKILQQKAKRLRKETGRTDLVPLLSRKEPTSQILMISMVRPLKLLFLSPIVFLICIYVATIFGILCMTLQ